MKTLEDLDIIIWQMNLPFSPSELQKKDAITTYLSDRSAIFYDVGGGKTLVSTLAMLLWGEPHNLIVCPPILLPQWQSWLNDVGQMDTSVFAGPKRTIEMLNHKWVIMSHAIFRDSYEGIKKFYANKQVAITVDEAQALKNPRSVLFRSVNNFISPDRRIILLTATPTSKPEDTYAYVKIKTPSIYRSMGHWENLHVAERDIFGSITKYRGLDNVAEWFAIKSIKRTKKELFGDNLDPVFAPLKYNLAPKHMKLYNKLCEEQLLLLPDGNKIDATSAQRLRHAVQQIIINMAKFSGDPKDRSVTFDLLDEVLEEVDPLAQGKSKLCIWTYYQSSSALVAEYLQAKFGKESTVAAYGAVDSAKSVDRIMHDDSARILVAQPTSVGVGLNLQHVCSEMLFLETPTVPMLVRQAVGRVDRAGQKIRPTIRFGLAAGTIQPQLFNNLLKNDEFVTKVERSPASLRDEIFGRTF